MTTILVMHCDTIVKAGHHPKRWRKTVNAILEKGKGPIIGKLRTITLIEEDSKFMMRMFLNEDKEEQIEKDRDFKNRIVGREKLFN